jgi:hybrid cluster-associated redox disulfide protein
MAKKKSKTKKIKKIKKPKRAKKKTIPKIITKDMILGEVIAKYPKTKEVFARLGLMCAICGFSMQETVEQAASVHGFDLEKLLNELNKVVR